MRICDVDPSKIFVGMRVLSFTGRKGFITSIKHPPEERMMFCTVTWDGEREDTSGFWENKCNMQIIGEDD